VHLLVCNIQWIFKVHGATIKIILFIVVTNGYLLINHVCCLHFENLNTLFIQQCINNSHKSQLCVVLFSYHIATCFICFDNPSSGDKKYLKKNTIEFNTIRWTALKWTVKGGRVTVIECYTRSVYLCYIDSRFEDTRRKKNNKMSKKQRLSSLHSFLH